MGRPTKYLKHGQAIKGDGPGKVNEVDTLSSTQGTGLNSIEHSQMLRKLQRFICSWWHHPVLPFDHHCHCHQGTTNWRPLSEKLGFFKLDLMINQIGQVCFCWWWPRRLLSLLLTKYRVRQFGKVKCGSSRRHFSGRQSLWPLGNSIVWWLQRQDRVSDRGVNLPGPEYLAFLVLKLQDNINIFNEYNTSWIN